MSVPDVLGQILGGLVFFVFGLSLVNCSFLSLTGPYFKVALGLLTKNRLSAVLVGTVLSFPLASSGAATVVLVSMGSAGLITLRQALAVILGAAIGTTLTVQLVAFDFGQWAVYILAAGFLVRVLATYERSRQVGNAVFGIGMLFFGLFLMKSGVQHFTQLASFAAANEVLASLTANNFYLFLIGIAAAAILQSSATTMALAFAFGVPVPGGIAIALGAAIGTTAPGVIHGLCDGRLIARRIGLGHFFVKLIGASLFMALLQPFAGIVERQCWSLGITSNTRIIAHANTVFNILNAGVFLLLLPAVEQLVLSLSGRQKLPAGMEGMSLGDLDKPELAVEKAHAQVVAMGKKALDMLHKNLSAFLVGAHRVTDEILAGEEQLDTWDTVLSDFLGRVSESSVSPEAHAVRTRLLYVIKDIEHIGDTLATELVPLARKKTQKGLDFSIEGSHHFEKIHRLVADDLAQAIYLLEGTPAQAAGVLENATVVNRLRREISQAHMRRVAQGVAADVEASRIFLDALAAVRTVHLYICDIVQVLAAPGGGLSPPS